MVMIQHYCKKYNQTTLQYDYNYDYKMQKRVASGSIWTSARAFMHNKITESSEECFLSYQLSYNSCLQSGSYVPSQSKNTLCSSVCWQYYSDQKKLASILSKQLNRLLVTDKLETQWSRATKVWLAIRQPKLYYVNICEEVTHFNQWMKGFNYCYCNLWNAVVVTASHRCFEDTCCICTPWITYERLA